MHHSYERYKCNHPKHALKLLSETKSNRSGLSVWCGCVLVVVWFLRRALRCLVILHIGMVFMCIVLCAAGLWRSSWTLKKPGRCTKNGLPNNKNHPKRLANDQGNQRNRLNVQPTTRTLQKLPKPSRLHWLHQNENRQTNLLHLHLRKLTEQPHSGLPFKSVLRL